MTKRSLTILGLRSIVGAEWHVESAVYPAEEVKVVPKLLNEGTNILNSPTISIPALRGPNYSKNTFSAGKRSSVETGR
jgi:hypothetical protein